MTKRETVKIEAKIPKPLFEAFQQFVVKGMHFKNLDEALTYVLRTVVEDFWKPFSLRKELKELKAKVALLEDAINKLRRGNQLIDTSLARKR